MAPLFDDYIIRLKNLHNRYKLSQTVMGLFRALGEHRRGYDPDALGRLMRMSPGMRKACTDTISQLAKAMQKDLSPSTIAECTELIQNCTDMLAMASKLTCLHDLPITYKSPVGYHQQRQFQPLSSWGPSSQAPVYLDNNTHLQWLSTIPNHLN